MKAKKFYLGCRFNPQLSKPYYRMLGQISKKEVKMHENASYGSMSIQSFDTESEYLSKVESLKQEGYRIY